MGTGRNAALLAHQISLLSSRPIVVLDVETTGISVAKGERVIEIGAVRVVEGKLGERFSSLVATSRPISPGALAIHKITPAMLAGQPTPEEVFRDFASFIGGDILVGHNVGFDMRFLAAEFARLGQRLTNSSYCTLKLSRLCYPQLRSHKLEILGRYLFGALPEVRHHRALDDAELAARVMLRIAEEHGALC
ncbi:MAG: 3'-5' exonuclease [Desulfuromonadaceae bacterium]|nr:3'-5' exonuclease [Desulfuromonadaceae bacterium]